MRLLPNAPDRSLSSFSAAFHGPYPQFAFLAMLIRDAFRTFRDSRKHS